MVRIDEELGELGGGGAGSRANRDLFARGRLTSRRTENRISGKHFGCLGVFCFAHLYTLMRFFTSVIVFTLGPGVKSL